MDRASVLRSLWTIHHYGVTELLPGRVRFSDYGAFAAFAPQKQFTAKLEDGVFIHGFWQEEFSGDFYIHRVERIVEGKNIETGSYSYLIPDYAREHRQNLEEYRLIDKNWIAAEKGGAFVRKAKEGLNAFYKVADTSADYMEKAAFYQNIRDFLRLNRVAREHGSRPVWDKETADHRCHRITLNRGGPHAPTGIPLERFIQSLITDEGQLVLVQFIDQQDVLHQAQDEFLNMLAYYIKDDFTGIEVTILDVVVRDERGTTQYLKDLKSFHGNNHLGPGGSRCNGALNPFVSLFGKVKEGARDRLPEKEEREDGRLLDFDLLYGCRSAENGNDEHSFYKINLQRAIHDVMRCAGLIANGSRGFIKDFRGIPEEALDDAQWQLERRSVVIKVYGRKQNPTYRQAAQAYYNLRLSGCPYVVLLLADGPEDVVEIHDDSDRYVEFSGEMTRDDEFYATIEAVAREKYATHRLGGAQPSKLHLPVGLTAIAP